MDRTAVLEALSRADSVHQARRLFSRLEYILEDLPGIDGASVVGRWRGFEIMASCSPTPRCAAKSLARKLAAASRRALAVTCGPVEVAIAAPRIGAPGITPLLIIPRADPPALAFQLLCELCPRRDDDGLAHALRVAEVLSAERVGERFFRRLRAALEQMASSLPLKACATDRRTAALITLTRVLFLYFVQAKGWLDGRSDYLRSLLDDALTKGRDFHRDVLHPLFFGTLNRPPAERSRRLRLGRVPYLNGGLFQPHPVERRLGGVRFSNDLWRETFDGLFERFRFCVREADEVTAVAPDMLGRVFERVMDDDERHETGTFYTPEAVVRQMVDAAIATALTGSRGLDPEATQRVIAGTVTHPAEARAAQRALQRLRVLDPAAGSGAFLLGTLERLTEIHLALRAQRDPAARCRLRREILRNNLFGVDLSPMAVRLAELRLWLALVADDPTDDIAAISPLPNLDGILRQGDTLLDPVAAARALGTPGARVPHATARTVAEVRAAMYQARGPERARLALELAAAERDLAERLITAARAAAERESGELVALASGRDLFGNRSGLSAAQRARYRRLRRHRAELRRAQRALRDGSVPFFSFDVHFPDVARAGFGIVLGNPPWVRAERLPPATRRTLASRFRWWRAAPTAGYGHLPDISIAFLERSLELTQPGGAVALLVP
ncbi:MAG: N-6 DNA methylase, partial [Gemmatimonadetes bacterium]|nr:N-6 DNA methylase [Gemmatimonadota bacterium]